MAKPRRNKKVIRRHISIPEDLCAEIDLLLYDPVRGHIAYGAWSEFAISAFKHYLNEIKKKEEKENALAE